MAGDGFLTKISLTTANVNLGTSTAWQRLALPVGKEAPTGNTGLGPQVLWTDVVVNAAAGSATLGLAVVEKETSVVVRYTTATVTVTTRRAGIDGASGDYVCTVAWAESGNKKVDLMDFNADQHDLYLGLDALATFTRVDVYACWTRAI